MTDDPISILRRADRPVAPDATFEADLSRLVLDELDQPGTDLSPAREPRSVRSRALAAGGAAALVLAIALPLALLTSGDPPTTTATTPPVAIPTTPPAEGPDISAAGLMPPFTVADGIYTYWVRLITGEWLSVSLPESIGQEIEGFVPGSALGWDDGVCCGRQIRTVYGDLYPGRTPDRVYTDAGGRPVNFYQNGDPTDELVFRYGEWSVIAWDGGEDSFTEESRSLFSSLVDGYQTSEGFLVLTLAEPMNFQPAHTYPDASFLRADGEPVAWFWREHSEPCEGDPFNAYVVAVGDPGEPTSICAPQTGDRLMVSSEVDLTSSDLSAIDFETTSPGVGWTPLPPSPLSARGWGTTTWTGSELIVWGGANAQFTNGLADGAAYDLVSGDWRMLSPAPLGGRVGHTATWTGTELVVWGGHDGRSNTGWAENPLPDGAAYDPATDTWRSIAPSPLTGGPGYSGVWTGAEVVYLGGNNGYTFGAARGRDEAAAYNPADDSWRLLTLPLSLLENEAAWTGEEVVVFGNRAYLGPLDGLSYHPGSDTWRSLPSPPIGAMPSITLVGDRVVVSSYFPEEDGMAYLDLSTENWVLLPVLPGDSTDGPPVVSSLGNDRIFVRSETLIAVYWFSNDRWQVIPKPIGEEPDYGSEAFWTGDRAIFVYTRLGVLSWEYRPPG